MGITTQADAVPRKTVTLLHIKNAPFGAFFGCFEWFFEEKLLFSLIFYVFSSGSRRSITASGERLSRRATRIGKVKASRSRVSGVSSRMRT